MNPNQFTIAIGSLRPPKVEAVRVVISQIAPLLGYTQECVSYIAREVASGVPAMPMSVHEIRRGALNRARAAKRVVTAVHGKVDLAVGLEGGIFIMKAENLERVHLQSWVYVESEQEGHYGSSMTMPIPPMIARAIIEDKRELAEVIDEYAGAEGTRNQDGAFGYLSLGFLSRQQAFELALFGALAPFYHHKIYSSGTGQVSHI